MRNSLDSFKHNGHEGYEGKPKKSFVHLVSFVLRIFTTENIWALILFLIVIALIVFTSDSSPVWIYQGF